MKVWILIKSLEVPAGNNNSPSLELFSDVALLDASLGLHFSFLYFFAWLFLLKHLLSLFSHLLVYFAVILDDLIISLFIFHFLLKGGWFSVKVLSVSWENLVESLPSGRCWFLLVTLESLCCLNINFNSYWLIKIN